MPLYKWKGVDVTGLSCSGKDEAISQTDLENVLRSRGIAILQAKESFLIQSRIGKIFPAKRGHTINELLFFPNLAELLDAGLFISDAVTLIANQQKKNSEGLKSIKNQLDKGHPLSSTLEPFGISSLILSLIRAGEETASLPQTTQLIARHLHQQQEFRSRIKAAIYMPIITLVFFVFMMLVIIFGLVPKIIGLFPSGTKLPYALTVLNSINHLFESPIAMVGLVTFSSALGGLVFWLKNTGKPYLDRMVLHIPLIRTWVINRNMANVLTSLGIMLDGGIPLSRALPLAGQGLTNSILRTKFEHISHAIDMGTPFSQAITEYLGLDDLAIVMALGEQTGRLAQLVSRAARGYEKQCTEFLTLITQIIQPALIIILGLGIAGLVGAVYLPILELAQGIPQGI